MTALKTKVTRKLKSSCYVRVEEREIIIFTDSKKGMNQANNLVVHFAKMLKNKLIAANSSYKHLSIYAFINCVGALSIRAEYDYMPIVKDRTPIL